MLPLWISHTSCFEHLNQHQLQQRFTTFFSTTTTAMTTHVQGPLQWKITNLRFTFSKFVIIHLPPPMPLPHYKTFVKLLSSYCISLTSQSMTWASSFLLRSIILPLHLIEETIKNNLIEKLTLLYLMIRFYLNFFIVARLKI